MSSRSLDDLHPIFLPKARDFVDAAAAAGLDVLVYCTYRDRVEQNELYSHGRTKPGAIVTWAPGGQSAHNYGMGLDGTPMIHGKPLWDEKHEAWQLYGHVAAAVGLEWAGTWTSKKREMPHVQHPKWREILGVSQ